ncbi:MAG: diaminopimelate decarboxylase [Deltaproteobacteria bacterium]|nr:diaminopimelate decarboxylase [Deltaproteobacteria bacterium]
MHLSNEFLLQCAKRYGTPIYVYNGDLILQRYRELFEFIPWPKLRVLYAMKANYNPAILTLLGEQGAGIDAVSPAEIVLALKCGYQENQILFTANNLTAREMHVAHALGVLFNIDTLSTIDRFGRIFPGSDLCLRFNPNVVAGDNAKVQTAGEASKFGILLSELSTVKNLVKTHDLRIVGLHIHTGSGIKNPRKSLKAMQNLLEIATPENFPDLQFIDFGGGLAVPYHPEEERIDYASFGKNIAALFGTFCENYGRELGLYLEPGKYIVAESGYLLMEVTSLKNNQERRFANTDSGFPHLIRPVLYDAYHHIVNLSNPHGSLRTYDICGNICESGDCFASGRSMPKIREEDILAVQNAGAYCYSMGGLYNLRAMPAEILTLNGKERMVRRSSSEEELVESILAECL